jgi:hypothetical protein
VVVSLLLPETFPIEAGINEKKKAAPVILPGQPCSMK